MAIDIKVLQNHIYEIFKEFDRVCKKYDIHYSMEGGTLLGAVKFKDYVPWDDDIDVVMKRDQYEKLLEVAPAELDSRFFLQSYHNVPEFPLNYAKLCLNGTEIYDYAYSKLNQMHHGIFMDIFPIDNVIPEKLNKHCSLVGIFTGARKTKLKVINPTGIRKLIYKSLALLPMKTLINMVEYSCKKYNKNQTGYMYEVCNSNRNFPPLPADFYNNTVSLPFRDGEYEAVLDYDNFLKSRFGENYASVLPDEKDRKPSHCQNIKINEQ